MRTLLHTALLTLLGLAFLHCSAEGAPVDIGSGDLRDGSAPEVDAETPDAPEGGQIADAGDCSADRWCRTPLPRDDIELTAVWSFAADDAVAASTKELLQWNGTSWTLTGSVDAIGLTSLWASTSNDVWGVARGGHRLVHGTRAAKGTPFTWSKIEYDPASTPTMDAIRGTGERDLWIVGNLLGANVIQHGTLSSAGDGGTSTVMSWTTIPIAFDRLRALNSFWVSPNRAIWLAGAVDLEFSSVATLVRGNPSAEDPSRYTWTEAVTRPPGGYLGFSAIWGEANGDLLAVSDYGESAHGVFASDGTVDFTFAMTHARLDVRSIWGSSRNDVWLAGVSGTIRHWDGSAWTLSRLSVGGTAMWRDLSAVRGGPDGDIWAVGTNVALHRVAAPGGSP